MPFKIRANHALLLPAITIILLLASFRYTETWSRYTSKDGHYSIDFPGTPTETVRDDSTDSKMPVRIHYATYLPNDSEGYLVDWIDISKSYPKGRTMKEMLEDSKKGALRSAGATSGTTTAINLGKQPYIEFTFSNEGFTGKDRIYIVNKIQYSIITLFPASTGIKATADKFINSFRHL